MGLGVQVVTSKGDKGCRSKLIAYQVLLQGRELSSRPYWVFQSGSRQEDSGILKGFNWKEFDKGTIYRGMGRNKGLHMNWWVTVRGLSTAESCYHPRLEEGGRETRLRNLLGAVATEEGLHSKSCGHTHMHTTHHIPHHSTPHPEPLCMQTSLYFHLGVPTSKLQ